MAPAPADASAGRVPAGFWPRYAAWSLDAACLLPLVALLGASRVGHALDAARAAWASLAAELPRLLGDALGNPQPALALAHAWLADPRLAAQVAALEAALLAIVLTPVALYAVLALPWAVGFERGPWRATPGKRALGLQVSADTGGRLTAGHALLRHLAAGLSWLTLNIGHLMAALPPAHLALHDRLSDTRVAWCAGRRRMPAWAHAWLAVQALGLAAAIGCLFLSLQAALQAAVQQALGLG
jgi:uncharacterized RDD family membrane protein YckC